MSLDTQVASRLNEAKAFEESHKDSVTGTLCLQEAGIEPYARYLYNMNFVLSEVDPLPERRFREQVFSEIWTNTSRSKGGKEAQLELQSYYPYYNQLCQAHKHTPGTSIAEHPSVIAAQSTSRDDEEFPEGPSWICGALREDHGLQIDSPLPKRSVEDDEVKPRGRTRERRR